MEVRRGTLRTFLLQHLDRAHVAQIMSALEPYYSMAFDEKVRLNLGHLANTPAPLVSHTTPAFQEDLCFALKQSLLDSLHAVATKGGRAEPPSDFDRTLARLLQDWITAECSTKHEAERSRLYTLVLQVASPHNAP